MLRVRNVKGFKLVLYLRIGGWLLAEYGVGGHLTRNVPR